MSYEVRLTDRAAMKLNALPPYVQGIVESRLEKLGGSPSSVSRLSVSPPYPPDGMIYEFDFKIESEYYHFAIFFKYGQDEECLYVIDIGTTYFDS